MMWWWGYEMDKLQFPEVDNCDLFTALTVDVITCGGIGVKCV